MLRSLVGSEMCIRDRLSPAVIHETAAIAAPILKWDELRKTAEIENAEAELAGRRVPQPSAGG